jgi:hypothetical protein
MHMTPPKDKWFDQLDNDVPISQILYAEDHHWKYFGINPYPANVENMVNS